MKKTDQIYLGGIVVALCVFLSPQNIFAAQINFVVVPNTVTTDRATIIEARIDPAGKVLNAVDGTIHFDGPIADALSVDVEAGGSLLTIWPLQAKYIPSEKSIRFVGGVPGGFDHEGLILRMRVSSSKDGSITLSWPTGVAYLNDGKGTKENISSTPTVVNFSKEDPAKIGKTSGDTEAPQFDSVEIAKDASLYDGKYFVSFHAVDDVSGVAHYEIKEGDTVTDVTDGIYVLKDQTKKSPLTITAFDTAGNSKTVDIIPRSKPWKGVMIILLLIIFYCCAFLWM